MSTDVLSLNGIAALTRLIPRTFSSAPTTRMSASDYAAASELLAKGDRAGMYLLLAEKTGNPAYINTVQISSGSGCTIGGPAIAVNAGLQLRFPDLYPNIDIKSFSDRVARAELDAFSPVYIGGQLFFQGPSELDSYIVGRSAWARVSDGRPEVADLFPGNLLLAAHYLRSGDFSAARNYLNDRTITVVSELSSAIRNEITNSGTQYGITLAQSWDVVNSGGSVRYEFAPGQNAPLMVFRENNGRVYSVFTAVDRQVCGQESNYPGQGIPTSPLRRMSLELGLDSPNDEVLRDVVDGLGLAGEDLTSFQLDALRSVLTLYSGQVDLFLSNDGTLSLAGQYRQTTFDLESGDWTSSLEVEYGEYAVSNSAGQAFSLTPARSPGDDAIYEQLPSPASLPSVSSLQVDSQAISRFTDQQGIAVLNDISSLIGSIQNGQPLPALNSGLRLLNTLDNLDGNASNNIPFLGSTTAIVGGLASLYNLSNALQNGDTLTQINATLSTLNYVNSTLPNLLGQSTLNAPLNTFLNGSGGGLINGGAPGVLPALGLVLSIRNGDPVGIATGLIGVIVSVHPPLSRVCQAPPARLRRAVAGECVLAPGWEGGRVRSSS